MGDRADSDALILVGALTGSVAFGIRALVGLVAIALLLGNLSTSIAVVRAIDLGMVSFDLLSRPLRFGQAPSFASLDDQ
jgi:hypothetical protein